MAKVETFATFHGRRAAALEKPRVSNRQREHFLTSYAAAEEMISGQGWGNPLQNENAHVLQMGVEGYLTAQTFREFIRGRNPQASITVADFSEVPLRQCIEKGLDLQPNMSFVKTDTTALGFSDSSFDLIETDCLLQFLSPSQKGEALAEWYRVLRPGGVVTTRDRFVSINEPAERWDYLNLWRRQLLSKYGVDTYATSSEKMFRQFQNQGFEVVFRKVDSDFQTTSLIHNIVARKPT